MNIGSQIHWISNVPLCLPSFFKVITGTKKLPKFFVVGKNVNFCANSLCFQKPLFIYAESTPTTFFYHFIFFHQNCAESLSESLTLMLLSELPPSTIQVTSSNSYFVLLSAVSTSIAVVADAVVVVVVVVVNKAARNEKEGLTIMFLQKQCFRRFIAEAEPKFHYSEKNVWETKNYVKLYPIFQNIRVLFRGS